ncbi:MAG: ABC transporter permease [Acholeplasmataceae bacterium]|nr:ABC transporter permease [Acholeplasmataceae bacterium]
MSKFKYLLKYQLKKRIFSKSFLISNIITLVALILIANISNIIRLFEPDQKGQKVLVVNETTSINLVTDLEELYLKTYKNGAVMHGGLYFEGVDLFNEEDKLPTLILKTDEAGNLKGTLHQFKLTETNTQVLAMTVGGLASKYFLESKTEEEKALITDYGSVGRDVLIINRLEDDSAVREAMGTLAMFLSIPIYILLMMAVQFVGGSIVEEKSSKAIEYIIANVSPQQHFFAKIFTSLIALVVQTLLIVIYGLIASLVSVLIFNQGFSGMGGASEMLTGSLGIDKEIVDSLLKYLPLTILYLILFSGVGGLMMMVLMAFVAAISTTNEEYQQFQSPMMIVMLIGFYGAMFGPMFGHGNLFVRIMSYIPFFSPMMVPSLYLSGSITWWDGLISLALLLITTIIVYRLVMPMYKQAILSYDTGEKMSKRIKKAFKAKDS